MELLVVHSNVSVAPCTISLALEPHSRERVTKQEGLFLSAPMFYLANLLTNERGWTYSTFRHLTFWRTNLDVGSVNSTDTVWKPQFEESGHYLGRRGGVGEALSG